MAGFLFKKTGLRCAQLLKRSMHVEKRYYSVTSKKKKFLSHYEILGIKQSANQSEIRAAFVELSKELHPDRNPDDPTTHDKFVRLNEAYSVLSKELSRKEYDMTLAYRLYMSENLSQAHHSDSYSGPGTASGPNEGFEQERVAWDETLWHMRDKKKFTGAPDDEFYGIKGIKKQSNSVIVAAGGFLFMALGFLYFLFGLK